MNPRDLFGVALDEMSLDESRSCVDELCEIVGGFKFGHERIQAQEAGQLAEYVADSHCWGFWDGKIEDIPNTAKRGIGETILWPGIRMTNVMCRGGREMMEVAAAKVREQFSPTKDRPWLLGVTVLTSLDADAEWDLVPPEYRRAIFGLDGLIPRSKWLEANVCHRAEMAKECGLDGVVASVHEVTMIRARCGPDFKIVTPGIRPAGSGSNDQKRLATPSEAIRAGADVIIVGRAVTQPNFGTRSDAAKRVLDEIVSAIS